MYASMTISIHFVKPENLPNNFTESASLQDLQLSLGVSIADFYTLRISSHPTEKQHLTTIVFVLLRILISGSIGVAQLTEEPSYNP
ncbi:hypothetical protein I308_106755 [Cryptococcus tetragattii IND107]|uniref:Uncharacterized protein n=1 Tax=Cryptococcus tetragattii IND107 TaxID=1296105 RepID=A0ABR3BHM3_9TREE